MTQPTSDPWIDELLKDAAQEDIPPLSDAALDRMTRAAFDAQDALRPVLVEPQIDFWQELRSIFWRPSGALSTAAAAGVGLWLALSPVMSSEVLAAPLAVLGLQSASDDTATLFADYYDVTSLSQEVQP